METVPNTIFNDVEGPHLLTYDTANKLLFYFLSMPWTSADFCVTPKNSVDTSEVSFTGKHLNSNRCECLIGLGLDDQNDISLKALELIKRAHKVYLECYTSIINSTIEQMERLYQCTLILADRHLLENTDILVEESVQHDVVLLVPGTPLFATTHTDLLIRCLEKNVKHQVVNNTSIYNVIGHVGLYSYSFGRVVSVPFFSTGFKPLSVFERILSNIRNDLHTLCLLDIKIGKSYYEEHGSASNRFMSANTAMKQLLEYEETVKSNVITEQTKIFVICRFGCRDQSLHYDEIRNLLPVDFGRPLHSLIIPARMETIEEEHVNAFFNKKRMI